MIRVIDRSFVSALLRPWCGLSQERKVRAKEGVDEFLVFYKASPIKVDPFEVLLFKHMVKLETRGRRQVYAICPSSDRYFSDWNAFANDAADMSGYFSRKRDRFVPLLEQKRTTAIQFQTVYK